MSTLDDFRVHKQKEETNPMAKYPIIWKTESCLIGECRGERTSHRWSVPSTAPQGLMVECYDCHKTRKVEVQNAA